MFDAGEKVGFATSGTMSPTLGKGIARARVGREHTASETPLAVEIKGGRVAARVVALPFYKRPKL